MRPRNEDLFQETTMTFGEHLEELRACLFKAIFGLVIGCLIGLPLGGYVVRFIQKPVHDALNEYYIAQNVEKVEGWRSELEKAGYTLPATAKALKVDIAENDLECEKVLVNPREVSGTAGEGKGARRFRPRRRRPRNPAWPIS